MFYERVVDVELPKEAPIESPKILIVDDDDLIRLTLADVLKHEGFVVSAASNVSDALKLISANTYDVLLSDLHMPGAGDGLTVVSAMRHSNPKAVTMLLSAFPEMNAASHAIMLQADQILVKPMDVKALIAAIKERLATGPPAARVVESVATILERNTNNTIDEWFGLIKTDQQVMAVTLTYEQRVCHLPKLFVELVHRLRAFKVIGSKELVSEAAAEHGVNRCRQGYSAAMLVEESRMLQVSVFSTLQKNLARIDFSILLTEVMTIADEIDSQLSQAMASYVAESASSALPA
ncbi:MAG: response regulator [Acidobacteriota bacterium]|nr:response regulator [Acidobacteriota bacterium]